MLQQTRIINAIKSFGEEEFTTSDVKDKLPEDVNPNSVGSVIARWKTGELYRSGWKETRKAMGKATLHKVAGKNRYYLLGAKKGPAPEVPASSNGAKKGPAPEVPASSNGAPETQEAPEYRVITVLVDSQGREWVLR